MVQISIVDLQNAFLLLAQVLVLTVFPLGVFMGVLWHDWLWHWFDVFCRWLRRRAFRHQA